MSTRGRTVYSTGPGGASPSASRDPSAPQREPAQRAAADHDLRVRIETAGRKGKSVTTVRPLHLTRADATALLKRLRKCCSAGGSLNLAAEGKGAPYFVLEVQGEHVAAIIAELMKSGYRVR